MQAAVGLADTDQAPLCIVEVAGDLPARVGLADHIALGIALVQPARLPTAHFADMAVAVVVVGCLAIFGLD